MPCNFTEYSNISEIPITDYVYKLLNNIFSVSNYFTTFIYIITQNRHINYSIDFIHICENLVSNMYIY